MLLNLFKEKEKKKKTNKPMLDIDENTVNGSKLLFLNMVYNMHLLCLSFQQIPKKEKNKNKKNTVT